MNKLMNAVLLLMIPIITFAQQERPTRASGQVEQTAVRSSPQFDMQNPGNGGAEVMTAGGGTNPVPIDDYTFFLIGIAVLIIAYVVYRRNQLSKA